jgi:hypothetical protein
MIEPLTGFHDMRSNPHIMIKGKAAPFFYQKKQVDSSVHESDSVPSAQKLSDEEIRILNELQLRDNSVREEEETHARMLGRHAGAIRYEYQIGPDGKPYVINGSVEVAPKFNSTNPEDIKKVLQTIRRAAVSVSNPSQADINIAASAATKVSSADQQAVLNTYTKGIELQSSLNSPNSTLLSSQFEAQA